MAYVRVEPTIRGSGEMPVELQKNAVRLQKTLLEAMQGGMPSSFPPQGCWRRDQPIFLRRQLRCGDSPDIRRRKRRLKTKTRNSDRRTEDSKRAIRKRTKHADTELDQRFGIFLIASWGFVYYSIVDKELRTHT